MVLVVSVGAVFICLVTDDAALILATAGQKAVVAPVDVQIDKGVSVLVEDISRRGSPAPLSRLTSKQTWLPQNGFGDEGQVFETSVKNSLMQSPFAFSAV